MKHSIAVGYLLVKFPSFNFRSRNNIARYLTRHWVELDAIEIKI